MSNTTRHRQKRARRTSASLAIAIGILLGGCSENGTQPSSAETGFMIAEAG